MPATSKAQFRFMKAAEHNPGFAARAGIKPRVAAEFTSGQEDFKRLPERKSKGGFHRRIARGG